MILFTYISFETACKDMMENLSLGTGVRARLGVTINSNIVIGARSVIKYISAGVTVFDNCCNVCRKLTEEEMK